MPKAIAALENIQTYLEERSPQGAARTLERIVQSMDVLALFPQIGREGPLPGIRELVIPNVPYIAFYRIEDDLVRVLDIVHTSRRYPPELDT